MTSQGFLLFHRPRKAALPDSTSANCSLEHLPHEKWHTGHPAFILAGGSKTQDLLRALNRLGHEAQPPVRPQQGCCTEFGSSVSHASPSVHRKWNVKTWLMSRTLTRARTFLPFPHTPLDSKPLASIAQCLSLCTLGVLVPVDHPSPRGQCRSLLLVPLTPFFSPACPLLLLCLMCMGTSELN